MACGDPHLMLALCSLCIQALLSLQYNIESLICVYALPMYAHKMKIYLRRLTPFLLIYTVYDHV